MVNLIKDITRKKNKSEAKPNDTLKPYFANYISIKLIFTLIALYFIVVVLGYGIYQGIWFREELGYKLWLNKESYKESSFAVSLIASALQDVLFFTCIGILIFIASNKDPKHEDLRTKVKYFYPNVENDNLMTHLIKTINKSSCIATETLKEITVLSTEGNLLEVNHFTHSKIRNLHFKHNIDQNSGLFYLVPDETVTNAKPEWGIIHNFHMLTETKGRQVIANCERLTDREYKKPYNIKLNAGESGTIESNHTLYCDKNNPLNLNVVMYTEVYKLRIRNTVKTHKLKVNVKEPDSITGNDYFLEPGKSLADDIVIKNIAPEGKPISIKFDLEKITLTSVPTPTDGPDTKSESAHADNAPASRQSNPHTEGATDDEKASMESKTEQT